MSWPLGHTSACTAAANHFVCDLTTMSFQPPRKCILSPEQLESFQSSKTYDQIVSYIDGLNEAVTGVKLNDASSVQGPAETDAQFKARSEDESEVRMHFNEAVTGSWIVQRIGSILKVLDRVEAIAYETPPVENSSSRFGNTAFRTFYKKISEVRHLTSQSHPLLIRQARKHHHFTKPFLSKQYTTFRPA